MEIDRLTYINDVVPFIMHNVNPRTVGKFF